MTVEEWALVASVVFTGLWSGLLAMLTLVLHPMPARMEGPEFARFLRAFLPTARHAPFNYAAVIGMVLAPAVARRLLVSSRLSEPNYDDAMLAWDPDAEGWRATRRRYFALNWIRAPATWAAFALFSPRPWSCSSCG